MRVIELDIECGQYLTSSRLTDFFDILSDIFQILPYVESG